jgi:hypothetical protein
VFTNALSASRDLPFEFRTDVTLGCRPHDYARNIAIRSAIEDLRVAKVWFIDSDVVPTPICTKLLTLDADIAAGCYSVTKREDDGVLRPQTSLYRMEEEGRWRQAEPQGESAVIEVDSAGMGMMVIDRKVFTDARMNLAPAGGPPILFRHTYNADGSLALGEDMDFCWRARRLGYRIVADTSVRAGHLKEIDLEEYRQALLTERMAPA